MKRRYRGRHRAADGGVPLADVTAKVVFDCPRVALDDDEYAETQLVLTAAVDRYMCDIPTEPFLPIVSSVFEGELEDDSPAEVGTHIAVRCPSCHHWAWTYRNTADGWAQLQRRIDEHHEQVH